MLRVGLSGDQEIQRETAQRFIDARCPISVVRELVDTEIGLPGDYLREAAQLGWFAMFVPEECGGGSVSGQAVTDGALIAEERGRGLQPGPFVSMNAAATALVGAGSAEQRAALLPAIASGESVVSWVGADSAGRWGPRLAVSAVVDADGFALSGVAGLVEDGAIADWFLVTAEAPSGVSQFMVAASTPGILVRPLKSHDITRRFASVSFDGVRVPATALLGEHGGAAGAFECQLELASVLTAAETVGVMDTLFEKAREYALDRTAFGRPIGSFQAVKHLLADMSLALEASKAVVGAAVFSVQGGGKDAAEIASMAKSWVSDSGIGVAQGCHQVFGGISFTWEHDLHLFLRRLTMNALLFGQSDWHLERICQIHGL